MVYGREIDGTVTTFGTTGYTYNNTFVLYDRLTGSVWYPMSDSGFDAIGGPALGRWIPFLAKPAVVPLSEWLKAHPETQVLLGDAEAPDAKLPDVTLFEGDAERF